MTTRSWMVRAWPTVDWRAPEEITDWPVFEHLGTDVRPEAGPTGKPVGDTVWAANVGGGSMVAVAWEWIELLPGVPVLSDPNGLICTARFITQEGKEEDELRAICKANLIAQSTPWQETVMSYLQGSSPSANPVPIVQQRRGQEAPSIARNAQRRALASSAQAPARPCVGKRSRLPRHGEGPEGMAWPMRA